MTGAHRAAMACGSPAADEWLASLGGASAIVEPPPSRSLPLVIAPAIPGAAVWDWVTSVRQDNMLTAHGRRPFTGDRRVFVAMGNSYLDTLGRAEARLEADRRA